MTHGLHEVHVCPLWAEADGSRRIGMEEDPEHGEVVGWVNVLVCTIHGEDHHLLAVYED